MCQVSIPQYSRRAKNLDVSTRPLTCPFAHLFTLLTHSLAPHWSLRSHAKLYSFAHLFAHSLLPELARKWIMAVLAVFFLFWTIVHPSARNDIFEETELWKCGGEQRSFTYSKQTREEKHVMRMLYVCFVFFNVPLPMAFLLHYSIR